jgi:hypothetical protein
MCDGAFDKFACFRRHATKTNDKTRWTRRRFLEVLCDGAFGNDQRRSVREG